MKYCLLIMTMFLGFQLSIKAQKPDSHQTTPKQDIHVNREYDEKGNLIKFDSVYSYSWSSDTTLLKSLSPENFQNLFNEPFGFTPDSTFLGNSFFGDLDHLFSSPFNNKRDSIFMHKFGLDNHFNDFEFNIDSLALNPKNFSDLFNIPEANKNDSTSTRSNVPSPLFSNPKSMKEMMKMFQQHMKEMEEYQKNFFKEQPGWKQF